MTYTIHTGGLKKFVYPQGYQPKLTPENKKYKLILIPKEDKKEKFYVTIDWEWGLRGEKSCKIYDFPSKNKFEKSFLGKETYIITIKKRKLTWKKSISILVIILIIFWFGYKKFKKK